MSKRPSIYDVAAAADVSITTVSHAFNGKGRLTAETRARVLRVAARLGYEPNSHAQGLATGRTKLLAIQVNGFGSAVPVPQLGYFVDLINGASATAYDLGFGLVLTSPGWAASRFDRISVDGALVVDPVGDELLLQAMRDQQRPFVTTGHILGADDRNAWVDQDHVWSTRLMLEHMKSAGCRRPSLLCTPPVTSYVDDLVRGYRSWCEDNAVEPRIFTIDGPSTDAQTQHMMSAAFQSEGRPDGVFASLDSLAIAALAAAREHGLTVPHDVMIAALPDSAMLRASTPPITAMDLHADRIGASAIRMLVELIYGGDPEPRHRMMAVELIPRASTARVPSAPRQLAVESAGDLR